jgi:type I restriction enzyme, S subunit
VSFPRYPEYKPSGVEWLGDIPTEWNVRRLRFVAKLNPSKNEVALLPRDTEVSFIPMEAVGDNGTIDLRRTGTIGEVENGYTYFRDGDVVVAKITPCFENGKGAVVRGLLAGIGFGTTELTVARPLLRQSSAEYLHWVFTSAPFRTFGAASMYGAGGQKRIPDDFFRDFAIALPALHEQIIIAVFLSRETAKIDALIAEQGKLVALLKEKRRAVISHAVTKGLNPYTPTKPSGVQWLGDVPAHWGVLRISSLSTKITNGFVGPTRDVLADDGVRYLQSLHIKGNRILFDSPYFVRLEWSNAHRKSVLEAGDVLIVQTGDIGQVAVVTSEFAGCNCHALIIVSPLRKMIVGEWLSWTLNSEYGLHSLLSIQTGALHPHLNCGDVKDLPVPVPPMDEQLDIIEFIRSSIARFDDLVFEAERTVSLLKERRSALISAAVTGQIDVREVAPTEAA